MPKWKHYYSSLALCGCATNLCCSTHRTTPFINIYGQNTLTAVEYYTLNIPAIISCGSMVLRLLSTAAAVDQCMYVSMASTSSGFNLWYHKLSQAIPEWVKPNGFSFCAKKVSLLLDFSNYGHQKPEVAQSVVRWHRQNGFSNCLIENYFMISSIESWTQVVQVKITQNIKMILHLPAHASYTSSKLPGVHSRSYQKSIKRAEEKADKK